MIKLHSSSRCIRCCGLVLHSRPALWSMLLKPQVFMNSFYPGNRYRLVVKRKPRSWRSKCETSRTAFSSIRCRDGTSRTTSYVHVAHSSQGNRKYRGDRKLLRGNEDAALKLVVLPHQAALGGWPSKTSKLCKIRVSTRGCLPAPNFVFLLVKKTDTYWTTSWASAGWAAERWSKRADISRVFLHTL